MTAQKGCVYLLGAGCGSADLITLRGLSLLQSCDALVYDDLIDEELLSCVPAGAERIYMGKRMNRHSYTQEEISAALIRLAGEGKAVVRLKGGDPYVFGRGGEEALALREAGIPCEVIPGISSAVAIPAMAGIPVTHRKLSRSFHVITAHTADTPDGLPQELDTLAALPGTLVFLMGLRQLSAIVRRLTAAGKSPDSPAAVISGGNALYPMAVRGTLADIVERSRDVRPPAVIVVGDTAAMDLRSAVQLPLSGARVAVTGTDAVTDALTASLRQLGAEAFCAVPAVVEELPFSFDWERLYVSAERWVVFTSANGVRVFFRRFMEDGGDLRSLCHCRFAVIGAATGKALARYGIRADLMPPVYTTAALAEALSEQVGADAEVFLFRSVQGSRELSAALEGCCRVEDVALYDVHPDRGRAQSAAERLRDADYLCFASAGGVELFWELYGSIGENTRCVCIGDVTAAALKKRYNKPFLIAGDISVDGIVESICGDWQNK